MQKSPVVKSDRIIHCRGGDSLSVRVGVGLRIDGGLHIMRFARPSRLRLGAEPTNGTLMTPTSTEFGLFQMRKATDGPGERGRLSRCPFSKGVRDVKGRNSHDRRAGNRTTTASISRRLPGNGNFLGGTDALRSRIGNGSNSAQ